MVNSANLISERAQIFRLSCFIMTSDITFISESWSVWIWCCWRVSSLLSICILQEIWKALSMLIMLLRKWVLLSTAITLTFSAWSWFWLVFSAVLPLHFLFDIWVRSLFSFWQTVDNQMQKFIQIRSIFWVFKSCWTDIDWFRKPVSSFIKSTMGVIVAVLSVCFCSFFLRCDSAGSIAGILWKKNDWPVKNPDWNAEDCWELGVHFTSEFCWVCIFDLMNSSQWALLLESEPFSSIISTCFTSELLWLVLLIMSISAML